MNTALRRAMCDKRISARQLALRVGVTAKTVERWVINPDLTPHPSTRLDASNVLGVSEAVLWPKATRNVVKTGHDREVLSVYPYRSACPSPVWGELIKGAQQEIFFAGYTNYFLWLEQPAFISTLRLKVKNGCRVRFMVGDPDSEMTRQREQIEDVALTVSTRIRITLENLGKLDNDPGVESRFSDPLDAATHVSLSVFRFDSEALVTPHLARGVGHDSPMMHLRHVADGGMFDRFADHAEELWRRGRPING